MSDAPARRVDFWSRLLPASLAILSILFTVGVAWGTLKLQSNVQSGRIDRCEEWQAEHAEWSANTLKEINAAIIARGETSAGEHRAIRQELAAMAMTLTREAGVIREGVAEIRATLKMATAKAMPAGQQHVSFELLPQNGGG